MNSELSSALIAFLTETTLAGSAAMVLVLCLRVSVRRWFGAGIAYALWLLVPLAMVAVLVPAPAAVMVDVVVSPPAVTSLPVAAAATDNSISGPRQEWPWKAGLAAIWLAGLVATLVHLARQQRRFQRAMGRVRRDQQGNWRACTRAGLPAVVGLLSPRIVLPDDFERRYTAEQQQLVLRHEGIHIARGDAWLNALSAALRCVYWFNPLVHRCVMRFRDDQEMSCDAQVLAVDPAARRSYGQAMLNTQLADAWLPIGCHWFGIEKNRNHPLKERLAMLNSPQPSKRKRRFAATALVFLAVAFSWLAWAAQPPALAAGEVGEGIRVEYSASVSANGRAVEIDSIQSHSAGVEIRADAADGSRPSLRVVSGDSLFLQVDAGESSWRAELKIDGTADAGYRVHGEIARNGRLIERIDLSAQAGQRFMLEAVDRNSGESLGIESTLSRSDPMPARTANVALKELGVLTLEERVQLGARGEVVVRERHILRAESDVDADALMRDPQVVQWIDEVFGFSDLHWRALSVNQPEIAADPLEWHSLTLELDPARLDLGQFDPRLLGGVSLGSAMGGEVRLIGENPQSRALELSAGPAVEDADWPSYRRIVPPVYSAEAVKGGEQGVVFLQVQVSEQGTVTEARVAQSSGHETLDRAAVEAVAQWTFNPARSDGQPRASQVTVPIVFEVGPGVGLDIPEHAHPNTLDQIYVRSL